jgi:hypothetical protein
MGYGEYDHHILNFNAAGVLAACGVTGASTTVYLDLLIQANNIIYNQVIVAAQKLNYMLKDVYRRDMMEIDEYRDFPRYISVMDFALEKPGHVGVFYDTKGVVQAKCVDVKLLGDLWDLQDIQNAAYPIRGSLSGWKTLYMKWQRGESVAYETTVDKRLDMMLDVQIAPFWQLIEEGNDTLNAWPQNRKAQTLLGFSHTYDREMTIAFSKVVQLMRIIATEQITLQQFDAAIANFNNQTYFGSSWTSKSGKSIFVINGSEKLVNGRLVAKGFFLGTNGAVLKRWSGWLPR